MSNKLITFEKAWEIAGATSNDDHNRLVTKSRATQLGYNIDTAYQSYSNTRCLPEIAILKNEGEIKGPVEFFFVAPIKYNNRYAGRVINGLTEEEWWAIWGERDAIIGEHTLLYDRGPSGNYYENGGPLLHNAPYDQYYIIRQYANENMSLNDWVNSKYNSKVYKEGIIYTSYTDLSDTRKDQDFNFINTIDRTKWSHSIYKDDRGNILSDSIYARENFIQLYPNITWINGNGIWDGTFYPQVDSVSIEVVAKVSFGGGLSPNLNDIIHNLPFRGQDERATYITGSWGSMGDIVEGENVDYYGEAIQNGNIYYCNVLPIYDGGDGI